MAWWSRKKAPQDSASKNTVSPQVNEDGLVMVHRWFPQGGEGWACSAWTSIGTLNKILGQPLRGNTLTEHTQDQNFHYYAVRYPDPNCQFGPSTDRDPSNCVSVRLKQPVPPAMEGTLYEALKKLPVPNKGGASMKQYHLVVSGGTITPIVEPLSTTEMIYNPSQPSLNLPTGQELLDRGNAKSPRKLGD